MKRALFAPVVAALTLGMTATAASAGTLYSGSLSGTVTSTSGSLAGVNVGSSVTGSYKYNGNLLNPRIFFNLLVETSSFNVVSLRTATPEQLLARGQASANLASEGVVVFQFVDDPVLAFNFTSNPTPTPTPPVPAPPTPIPTPALLPGLIGLGLSAWRKRKSTPSPSS